MRRLAGILLGGMLVVTVATPAFGQATAWQRKWYWGAQSGAFLYKDANGTQSAFDVGGHWLITGKRSALFVAFDQLIFPANTSAQIAAGTSNGTVTFKNGRRLQAMLYAIPTDASLQIYLGGGFAIEQITDGAPAAGSALTQAQVDAVDSKAFAVLGGGFNLRFGRWALFAQYQYMPAASDFILTSEQHAITGGLRYALSSAHEEVTTEER